MKRLALILLCFCGCDLIEPASITLPPSPAGSGFNDVSEDTQAQPSSAAVQPARDEDIAELKAEVSSLHAELDALKEICHRPPETTVEPKPSPSPATAPVVFYFLAPFPCAPCDKMLADIKGDTEFQWIKAASPWTQPYPGQQWQIRGQWVQRGLHVGWSNLADFKAAYRASLGVP